MDVKKQTPEFPQRWLTADAMCTLLGIHKDTLYEWVKKKYIVRLGGTSAPRFLDPGPEYVERLKLGRALHAKASNLPIDLSLASLLTCREVAEIMGWSIKYAKVYLSEHKIPGLKQGKRAVLYSAATVRKMIWARNGRKKGVKNISPFLLSEIVEYFRRWQQTQDEIMPTDSQFENDAILMQKIELMMKYPSPQREIALKALMQKIDAAKRVLSALQLPESGTPAEAPSSARSGFDGLSV